MAEVTKMERVVTMMPSALVKKISVEWHRRQLDSFSATIRKLLEEALAKK